MFEKPQDVLVIAAHPDDEVLGCGGTMARLAANGSKVSVFFLADGVGARSVSAVQSEALDARRLAAEKACRILGAEQPTYHDFPDNRMDTVALLTIAQAVEAKIAELKPGLILTHHAGDVNVDHQLTHQAVITACRPQPGHCVRKLLFFEVASSTEWQAPGSAPPFQPSTFVDIGETLAQKIEALDAYAMEMRPWPHSRSLKAAEHHARWRGATVGFEAAEAFVHGRELV
jgi:LmbE family N-acetylglucosaminyl deacetylase